MICDILVSGNRNGFFLSKQQGSLVGVIEDTVLCCRTERDPFYLGVNMPTGVYVRSEEIKRHLRFINLGKKLSPETCKKMSEGRKGKHLSDETKRKISIAHKGKTHVMTDARKDQLLKAQKLTLSSHQKGVKHTKEWKEKQSLGLKKYYAYHPSKNIGRKLTVEHRQKVSEGLKGHSTSEETRRKISLAKCPNPYVLTCLYCGKKKQAKSYTKKFKKRFCSKNCYGKWMEIFQLPNEHPNWKGGISTDKKRYRQRREAIERAGGELPFKRIQMVYEDNIKQYGTLTCYLCLKPIKFSQDSLEHKIPLCRGGTNQYDNLAIAHRRCNCKKGRKTFEEWKGEKV